MEMTEQGQGARRQIEMQHMDLWFDLVIRGEPNLEQEVLVRYQLTDGSEPDPTPDDRGNEESDPASEFF
jgi:hypothetical protein